VSERESDQRRSPLRKWVVLTATGQTIVVARSAGDARCVFVELGQSAQRILAVYAERREEE